MLSLVLVVVAVGACQVDVASGAWSNAPNRSLLVLAAPSVFDGHYRPAFFALVEFQIEFALAIRGRDNVVVLVDKHTRPYYEGRSHKVKKKLPRDMLLQANVYDIRLRDFAPFDSQKTAKFVYRDRAMDELFSRQVDSSMRRFMAEAGVRVERMEKKMVLSGADVVDNGLDCAIVSRRIYEDNNGSLPDWAVTIKTFTVFGKTVTMFPESNFTINHNRSMRLDDLFAFIDNDVLVTAMFGKEDRMRFEGELWKRFRNDVRVIELPTDHNMDHQHEMPGNCGLYSSLIATEKFIYLPMFGRDPLNWKMGHSSMMDKMVKQIVSASSSKTVVAVNVPRAVCQRGFSLRSLSWNLKADSNNAQRLVQLARWKGRRRKAQLV